jgi:hypothetical protein
MSEPFVPIEDVAKHFSVSVSTVRAWLRQGLIPMHTYIKMGNTYRFSVPKVVEALTNRNEQKTEQKEETVKPETEEPVQLELDLSNPDDDV